MSILSPFAPLFSAAALLVAAAGCVTVERPTHDTFDKAVRGRLVFGAKVIRPAELVSCPVSDGSNSI